MKKTERLKALSDPRFSATLAEVLQEAKESRERIERRKCKQGKLCKPNAFTTVSTMSLDEVIAEFNAPVSQTSVNRVCRLLVTQAVDRFCGVTRRRQWL